MILQWEDKYCQKFGLCKKDGVCQCKAELRFIKSLLTQAVQEERERIMEALKYDLLPVQIREENPSFWQGYNETVAKIISLINKE